MGPSVSTRSVINLVRDTARKAGEMGSKDKGGTNVKKKAQHSLKQKRDAKKAKKTTK